MNDIKQLAADLASQGKVSLFQTAEGTDKEYHAEIKANGNAFDVQYRYGRRGSALKVANKNTAPLERAAADALLLKIVKEKLGGGYTPSEEGVAYQDTALAGKVSGVLPQLLNPIEESELNAYNNNNDFWMQQKRDGERRMLAIEAGQVQGINRKGLFVATPQPLVDSIQSRLTFKGRTVLDGEIIGSVFYGFDILELDGVDMTGKPYSERLDALNTVLAVLGWDAPETAKSSADKIAFFADMKAMRAEGVVYKRADAPYNVGRPNSGGNALKFKFVETATVQVGQTNLGKRSVEIFVNSDAGLVSIGNVTIPPNAAIPAFGALIEVQYLYYFNGGSIFQPVFLRNRTDLSLADDVASLKRKPSDQDEKVAA